MRLAVLILLSVMLTVPPLTAQAQSDDICAQIVIPMMIQSRLDETQYGRVLGCETDGTSWRMRKVSEISPESVGSAETERGRRIQKAVDLMTMDDVFTYSVRFGRTSASLFTIGTQNKTVTSDLSDQNIGSAPNWLNNYVDDYARDMEVYLLNNAGSQPDLVEYLYWFISRRDATLQTMSSSQNPMASTAFLANWGYMQWPWPWQLADPVAIEDYVTLTEPEQIASVPVESPTSAADYTEVRTFSVGVFFCGGEFCEGLVGVTIHYESTDGALQGSCVTKLIEAPWGETAWCDYLFHAGVPTVLTVDESTIPTGWKLVSDRTMTFLFPENPDGPIYPVFFEVAPD